MDPVTIAASTKEAIKFLREAIGTLTLLYDKSIGIIEKQHNRNQISKLRDMLRDMNVTNVAKNLAIANLNEYLEKPNDISMWLILKDDFELVIQRLNQLITKIENNNSALIEIGNLATTDDLLFCLNRQRRSFILLKSIDQPLQKDIKEIVNSLINFTEHVQKLENKLSEKLT